MEMETEIGTRTENAAATEAVGSGPAERVQRGAEDPDM